MDAPCGGSGYYQIPSCFENPRGTELLPERDIKLAPRSAAADQPAHDHSIAHSFYYEGCLVRFQRPGGKSISGLPAKKPQGTSLKPAS